MSELSKIKLFKQNYEYFLNIISRRIIFEVLFPYRTLFRNFAHEMIGEDCFNKFKLIKFLLLLHSFISDDKI